MWPTDLALEKALFGCVLKPLKIQLQQTLISLHTQDGSLQKITDSLLAYQEGALERLAVRVAVLDARGVDRAKAKLTLMQRSHSPIDKVLLLLQVCKSVYKAMGTQPGEERFRCWFVIFRATLAVKTWFLLCRSGCGVWGLPTSAVLCASSV